MSRGSQETRAELLGAFARELRQFTALGSSFFRAAAARTGMTVTDLEVLDILDSGGPVTAGQLAERTGLTTGAITGMLNRLEEAKLVQRERDPNDGRRVIVRLAVDEEKLREVRAIFDAVGAAWEELAAQHDDEQIAFLVEFLKRGSALSREEILRLREAPAGEKESYSAPLGDLASGRLVAIGVGRLTVRADGDMTALYQARFEGPAPEVKSKDGEVSVRYPKRLTWALGGGKRAAEVTLNAGIPWRMALQGGGSEIAAELDGLDLAELEVKGGFSMVRLELPTPTGAVPIRVSGAASDLTIRRPAGVAARVHLKGWTSTLVFDEQRFSNIGSDVRMQSSGYDAAGPGYDIEVVASASMITITAG